MRATRLVDACGEPALHLGAQAIPASNTGGSEFEYPELRMTIETALSELFR